MLLGLGRDDAFTSQQARIRQLEAIRFCELLQLLKVLARAGREEQGGPVSLLIGEPKFDLAVELDGACRSGVCATIASSETSSQPLR